jgi:hypothetical protein
MAAELRMYFDNQAASAEQLDLFRTVQVDQAIGMVTEGELEMELALDETGRWTDLDQGYVQPFARVRVEVRAGEADFVPLIDGPVIGQRLDLAAAANQSRLTLVVHDDSVWLNQVERVTVFEEMSAADIATQLFEDAGLEAEVDPVAAAGGTLERAVVQRGTPMQLLRELARRHGMFVYVRPGAAPGSSVGVFRRADLTAGTLPELVLLGPERNLDRLSLEFDGLRPLTAAAAAVDAADLSILRAEANAGSQSTLGDEAALALVQPAALLLARTRETDSDLNDAVTAAVDFGTWAYAASGEVDGAAYPAVLQPYGTVSVAGAGPLSGSYLISRVTHRIDNRAYRQRFELRRNARTGATGAGAAAGGVF